MSVRTILRVQDVDEETIALKHGVGSDALCRGRIVNGIYNSCKSNAMGILAYSLQLVVADTKDADFFRKTSVSERLGACGDAYER